MLTRRTLAGAALALLAACTAVVTTARPAQAATGTSMTVRFEPAQSRYPRGTPITLAARLSFWGGGVANRWVEFRELSTRGDVSAGWACTDGSGVARVGYRVPTDPLKDNVCIYAVFRGDAIFARSTNYPGVRIPIGL